ncbi:MAG: thioredoxin family protein [Ignavibacteriaceae bacterium]|nr:thioredoxin family protein [Ignavibacteriaceae bacterium]
MLRTNLTHLLTEEDHKKVLSENENVMVCCGRMGPMCIPVYESMEELETEYPNVKFVDMEFDTPDAKVIRNLPQTRSFQGLPFVVYYKNGEVVHATSSIQSRDQITGILDKHFGNN